ncbi:MAG: TetR/AcrR family transcriptional regulator [Oscillospiraceae bacterium]|jgi:AcrR family transcriptional regulator|nr:TetR/AcrR family transcriptional regulator [Oscillospiraceae bacterium]
MGGKLLENKKIKMTKLYNAAYDLFTSKGVHATVVDEIVRQAGVAKGTFYLYCRDKYDLVNKVILKRTSALLEKSMAALAQEQKKNSLSFQESVIFFVDSLIQAFRNDTPFLELIFKNLSPQLFERLFGCAELEDVRNAFVENFTLGGGSSEAAGQRLYLIVCMVGAVCYSSLIMKTPYGFDEVRPELYRSIERILT